MASVKTSKMIDSNHYIQVMKELGWGYTISVASFRLVDYVDFLSVQEEKKEKIYSSRSQLLQYNACLGSQSQGWTLAIAGSGIMPRLEMIAAEVMYSMPRSPGIINAGRRVAGHWYNEKTLELPQTIQNGTQKLGTFLISGLRWEAESNIAFDCAFDILNSLPPTTNRIIVCYGSNPIEVMRFLGHPVQRILNVNNYSTQELD